MTHAELRLTAEQFAELRKHLLPDDAEHAAILVCGTAGSDDLLLCRRIVPVTANDLQSAGPLHLNISPIALARAAKQARGEDGTIVICHSHPVPGTVAASPIDLDTESDLCGRVLPGRLDRRPVGALIIGPDGHDGRLWRDGVARPLALTVGGQRQGPPRRSGVDEHDRDARQLLVWGAKGQRRLQQARVAIVGAGGTGSHAVTQLAHLGVGHLVLIDDDVIERSNLSRLLGATDADVGRAKVDVLADVVARVRPGTTVQVLCASVVEIDAARLATSDLIVCCTDGHGSRALLTELAAQYLVPLIDLGIEIQAGEHRSRAGGGVRVVRPGEPCLHCMGVLDGALVREEFLTDDERRVEQARGYLRNVDEPAPSVVSLNGVVASLAVVEAIDLLLDVFAIAPRRVLYRAEARSVTTATTSHDPGCFICGDHGILGVGDARRLPRRHPQPRAGSA